MIIAMGSSINLSVLKEKEHPLVVNRSLLIKNLLGQIVVVILIEGAHLCSIDIHRMKYSNEKKRPLSVSVSRYKIL